MNVFVKTFFQVFITLTTLITNKIWLLPIVFNQSFNYCNNDTTFKETNN